MVSSEHAYRDFYVSSDHCGLRQLDACAEELAQIDWLMGQRSLSRKHREELDSRRVRTARWIRDEMFFVMGLMSYRTADGVTLSIRVDIRASVESGFEIAFLVWLMAHDFWAEAARIEALAGAEGKREADAVMTDLLMRFLAPGPEDRRADGLLRLADVSQWVSLKHAQPWE